MKPLQSEPEEAARDVERLTRENERLRPELIERDRKLAEAEKQISEAEKQIADLERQLALRRQNSVTSSKPPSSDGLAGEQRTRGRKKGGTVRKPGGQPGHRGSWRRLAPVDRVDHVIDLPPQRCRHCDNSFAGTRRKVSTEDEPRRHQVTELPPIQAELSGRN